MAKIEGTPLNMVLCLTQRALMETCRTTNVDIIGVGYAVEFDDLDHLEDFPVRVGAKIKGAANKFDNGIHTWVMIWNEDACDFHTIMRLDQNKNK